MIKIEPEMDYCVNEIGGIKVSNIIGKKPSFLNADYLFTDYKVIAELKCLDENKIKDESIKRKATEIYRKYLSKDLIPKSPTTELIISDEYPVEFRNEIAELYRIPIHEAIKKANKQIKDTQKNLKLENHHGLLLLANEKHTALEPTLAMWILDSTFKRYTFSGIDSIIYFTTNLKAKHLNLRQEILIWIASNRNTQKKCPIQLVQRLQKSWIKRVSSLTKEPIFEIIAEEKDIIKNIRNK